MSTISVRLSPAELEARLAHDSTVRLIDVRTPGEFEAGHIEGSYNVPLDNLSEHARELAMIDNDVVLICQSGFRAAKAEATLTDVGMGNLRLLDGGVNAWMAGGRRVRVNRDRWSLERQVRLVAGVVVVTSIAASVWFPRARYVAGALGAGLTFAAATNTCAMGMLLTRLPYNRGGACDVSAVVERLRYQPTA